MSSIMDDLKKARGEAGLPPGKFWQALAALRDKDEDGYQAYADALLDPSFGPAQLQKILTRHTGISFGHSRISEVRETITRKEDLPV